MKIKGLALLAVLLACSCASEGYNTQKGAAIGAVGGALAGQAIGHNTAGTLIGAAGGALVGAVAGNAVDQSVDRKSQEAAQTPATAQAASATSEEAPPGRWTEVPGQWIDGKWVPPHKVWTPVNPGPAVQDSTRSVPSPPVYTVPAPPAVVPVPGTNVYFIPDIDVDILFYHGHWYRSYGGNWYRSSSYNGPWGYMPVGHIPHALLSLPPGYRRVPPRNHPIPHADLQRNWERWEREPPRNGPPR